MGVQLNQWVLTQNISLQWLVGTLGDQSEVEKATIAAGPISTTVVFRHL